MSYGAVQAAGASNALGLFAQPSASSKYASGAPVQSYGSPALPPLENSQPAAAAAASYTDEAPLNGGAFITSYDPSTYQLQAGEEKVVFGPADIDAGFGAKIASTKLAKGWSAYKTGRVTVRTNGSSWWIHQEKPTAAEYVITREAPPAPSPAVKDVQQQAESLAEDIETPPDSAFAGDASQQTPGAGDKPAGGGGLSTVLWVGGIAFALWLFSRMRR